MLTADRDPKGYFAALGVDPGADLAAVKAAFHARAKQLHPDRNPAPGAQAAFQRAAEAYRVLRDPLHRLGYERLGEGPPAAAALAPHACCRCGRVSAQPRFVAFPVVRSCLVTAQRHSEAGIFCPACARATALKASLTIWLRGWWSPQGLVLAPLALMVNLAGGVMPRAENFELLLRQARAFAARGEHETAAALALQARAFAADPTERDRLERAGHGLQQRPADAWGMLNAAFVLQMVPLAGLLATVAAVSLPDLPLRLPPV